MPLPQGAHPGQLADGTLVWLDAQNQPINADGTPMATSQAVKPMTPAPNTAPPASLVPPGTSVGPISGPPVPGVPASVSAPAVAPSTTPPVGAGGVQVPAAGNIDANAGAPPPAPSQPNTAGAAGATGGAGANPATVTLPAGTNPLAEQLLQGTQAQLERAQAAHDAANKTVVDLRKQYETVGNPNDPNYTPQAAQALSSQITNAEIQLGSANTNLSAAATMQSQATQNVLDKVELTPKQAEYYTAQATSASATAKKTDEETKILTDGADSQKAAVEARSALDSAQARLAATQAQLAAPHSQAEIDALHAQAAKNLQDVADAQRQAKLKDDALAADTTLKGSQAGLTDSESAYYKSLQGKTDADAALVKAQTTLLTPAQAAQAQGAAAQSQATATSLLEGITQKQQGPLYGIPQQIDLVNKIAQQVFGPGGTGNPDHADNLLQTALTQVVPAAIAGTTPYAGAVAAQNANQNQFQTQAAMWNQASQSAAARANAFAGTAGSALGSMLQANQWMPKGSTAMGDAFQYFLDQMKTNMGGPQAFMPGAQPTPAPMPALLAGFAAGHQAGTAQAGQGQGQAAPTVNINVNGQPSGPGGAVPQPYTGGPAQLQPIPNQPAGQGPPPMIPQGAAQAAGTQSSPGQVPGQNYGAGTAYTGGQSPADAFAQGLANNQPGPMPNYLSSLVDPMSMLRTGRGLGSLYNQGPGVGTPAAGSLLY